MSGGREAVLARVRAALAPAPEIAPGGAALARRFERVFADAEVVVSPSASCVAYLRENGAGLDGRLAELTEFLVDRLGVEDVGATFPHRVTLHPTCHSVRLMRIGTGRSGCCSTCAGSISSSCMTRLCAAASAGRSR